MDGVGVPNTSAIDLSNSLLGVAVALVFLYLIIATLRVCFKSWNHRRLLREEIEHDWQELSKKFHRAA